MAGRTRSARASGIPLTRGTPLLHELSRYFSTIDEVIGLAVHLLKDLPTGGRSYVLDSLPPSSSVQDKAHSVLEEWCRLCPAEANGQSLLDVLKLKTVNPVAAVKFKTQLLVSARGKNVLAFHV